MEKVVYIIPNLTYKKGMFKSASVNLVVTDKRLIVAHITKEMLKEARKEAGGFLRGITSGFTLYKKYYEMEPEKILQETADNFSIPISEIKEIKLKSGDSETGKQDEIEVKWRQKDKFHASANSVNMREFKNKLKDLGVHVKGGGFFGF